MFSFFRRKYNKEITYRFEVLNEQLKSSFSYIKKDMHHVSKWINHFKDKHDDHDKQFRILLNRMNRIESEIEKIKSGHYFEKYGLQTIQNTVNNHDSEKTNEGEDDNILVSDSVKRVWDSLTFTQRKILWKLAVLQKELPDQWISLKYLAQEMYPDKEYSAVRSTLSQFVAQLEEFGFIKRKRKGKLAYVCSTKKNPALKKKKKILLELEE